MMLRSLVGVATIAIAIAAGAGCSGSGGAATSSAADTAPSAKAAAATLAAAIGKKDDTDARLSRAMGRVGPMLTSQQQAAFTKAFNALPDVIAVENDYHLASTALAAELDAIANDPRAVASYGPSNLVDAYALLSQTPAADHALAFGVRLLAHDPTLMVPGVTDDDVLDKLIGPSLAGAYLQDLFATGTTAGASSALQRALGKGGPACLRIANWLATRQAFDHSDITADLVGVSSTTTIDALRAIAGIMAIWELGDDLSDTDRAAAISDLIKNGPSAIAGLAGGIAVLRRVMFGIPVSPLAETVMQWSLRVATGVTFVVNALQLYDDSGQWNDSLDAKAQIVGDLLAVGASILTLAGFGPAGVVVGAIGIGVTLVAGWLKDRALDAQEHADVAACLPATGLAPNLVTGIDAADPSIVATLTGDLALAPADIQWLIGVDPRTVDGSANVRFIGTEVARKIFGLDEPHTIGLMKAAVGGETDPTKAATRLELFFHGTDFTGAWNVGLSRSDAIAWLTDEANDVGDIGDDNSALFQAAFLGARDYLAE